MENGDQQPADANNLPGTSLPDDTSKGSFAPMSPAPDSGMAQDDRSRQPTESAAMESALDPSYYATSERTLMLELARKALASSVSALPPPDVSEADLPLKLTEKRACFVTLRKQQSLRGCIGNILAQDPLYLAIVTNARNAATRDPRFPPVGPEELALVQIEISVLSEPRPVSFTSPDDLLGKLQPHHDGVVLRIGSHMATFLPQVWDQLPRKEEFLKHLALKAGCEASAWQGPDTNVSTYDVESFEEPEPGVLTS